MSSGYKPTDDEGLQDAWNEERTALAKQPAPVLTDAETIKMAEAAGMSKPTELMVNDYWMADTKDILQFAALVRAAAVPPGHVVVPVSGLVYAVAFKNKDEVHMVFDTPAQANGFVEVLKPTLAARPGEKT